MIQRSCITSKTNSFFLFGPRGAGKTTFLHENFEATETLWIDLLHVDTFDQIVLDLNRFEALVNSPENAMKRVVVDEVQKIPRILDVVHGQIQKTKRQFILTGSSARKLKQAGTNLLAGRAWIYHLYPFTTFELGDSFDLKKVLERGSLPDAILAANDLAAREYLNAYSGTYLQKEIQ